MSMSDPIADMLTRIRNAQRADKASLAMPASKVKLAIAKVLKDEGYIADYSEEGEGSTKQLTVSLRYYEGNPVIANIKRISRPGRRVYKSKDSLPKIDGGLGVAIISTSAGVMSDRAARAQGHGGEVLCIVT